jgi:hypothetical protein
MGVNASLQTIVLSLTVITCVASGLARASGEAVDWSAWQTLGCIGEQLPREYSYVVEHDPIDQTRFGEAEVALLLKAIPPDLPANIRRAAKRLWPDQRRFYLAVERDVERASFEIVDAVARSMYRQFSIEKCIEEDKPGAVWSASSFIIDAVGRRMHGNVMFKRVDRRSPYYALLIAGGYLNRYPRAPEFVLEHIRER